MHRVDHVRVSEDLTSKTVRGVVVHLTATSLGRTAGHFCQGCFTPGCLSGLRGPSDTGSIKPRWVLKEILGSLGSKPPFKGSYKGSRRVL